MILLNAVSQDFFPIAQFKPVGLLLNHSDHKSEQKPVITGLREDTLNFPVYSNGVGLVAVAILRG